MCIKFLVSAIPMKIEQQNNTALFHLNVLLLHLFINRKKERSFQYDFMAAKPRNKKNQTHTGRESERKSESEMNKTSNNNRIE